jgi:hypothetical protein
MAAMPAANRSHRYARTRPLTPGRTAAWTCQFPPRGSCSFLGLLAALGCIGPHPDVVTGYKRE